MADPLLVRTEKGPTVLCGGIPLYPPDDPIEHARRKARVFSAPPGTLVFVPSVGLGHGLAELLARLPEGSAVLCIECDRRLMSLATAEGLPSDPRLLIAHASDLPGVAGALARLGVSRFRRVVEIPLCAGYRLHPGVYAGFRRFLEAEISRFWRNRITLVAMGSLQVRNLLANLPLLPHARDFSTLWTPGPVVVAGAGPSLEESLPLLRAFRGSFALVAVDTALPLLAAEALTPDLVVVLEAQLANLQDFIPSRAGRAPVACDLTSHPSAVRLFRDRLFFFCSEFAPLRLFKRMAGARLLPAAFPALGSVGVAATHAALRLTSGPVFLTGLDFSFPGSRTHARGTPPHLATLITSHRLRAVGQDSWRALTGRIRVRELDKRGSAVDTDSVLRSYRDTLARLIEGSQERVGDIGPTGLDLGARLITAGEFEKILSARGDPSRGVSVREGGRFASSDLRSFLRSESDLLSRSVELLQGALSAGTTSSECAEALRAVDYTWVHFPDEPDENAPGRSFLARARVAAGYYAQRLERIGTAGEAAGLGPAIPPRS